MFQTVQQWFLSLGLSPQGAEWASRITLVLFVALLCLFADLVTKRLLLALIKWGAKRSKTRWDDFLIARKVFDRLAHLAPTIIVLIFTPVVFVGLDWWINVIDAVISIYIIVLLLWVISAFLDAVLDIYRTTDVSQRIPIRSFIQVGKIIFVFIGGLFILSVMIGQSPTVLIASLGAISAVLMLVFREPLLGLAAGIQISSNQMIRRGDWIEMPKYGSDGDVLDVSLTTVKVQNWDKTISYIPTSAFLTASFKNWRGMSESGGRRIKRSLNIDMSTIRFCDEPMLQRFVQIQYIRDYIDRKKRELSDFNAKQEVDDASLVNGRRLTNVGTFRAYVIEYLRHHPMIHDDMTFLVRQLAPTPQGLPIEIYVFSKDQVWANYEGIQADLFDHILAVVAEFDLRVFQTPAGSDVQALAASVGAANVEGI